MVIGNGLLARIFSSYSDSADVIVFASGVSDSRTSDTYQFLREENLLKAVFSRVTSGRLIYFSTCSVLDPSTQASDYVIHKMKMEQLVVLSGKPYHIFRLPQLVGHTKSPTLVKVLYDRISNGQKFELWQNSSRNLIDADDVFQIANVIISKRLFVNQIVDIAAPFNTSIIEIVRIIQQLTGKEPIFEPCDKGGEYKIPTERIESIVQTLGIEFDKNYVVRVIEKYYGGPGNPNLEIQSQ